MSRITAAVAVAASALAMMLWQARTAWAHNCQDFTDCYATADAAATGLLGAIGVLALSIAVDLSPLGRVRGGVEAVTGRDLLTGQPLTMAERALGVIPGGRSVRALGGVATVGMTAVAVPKLTRGGFGTAKAPLGLRHLLHGEINARGAAVGFHHRRGIGHVSRARIRPGSPIERRPDGVYQAHVDVYDPTQQRWVPKERPSTFFPDDWSRQRVLEEIDGAWRNATIEGSRWRGVSPSGIRIEGWLTGGGTAYPRWIPGG